MKKINTDASDLRQSAEELLKKKPPGIAFPASEADALRFLHEFEVLQIELELQQEELVWAEEQSSKIAADKYDELYDLATVGYFTLNRGGEILGLNNCGVQMLALGRNELINNKFKYFVAESTREVFDSFFDKLFDSRIPQTCEVTLLSQEALPVYVQLNGTSIAGKDSCLLIAVDISSRVQVQMDMEVALAEAKRFRNALDHISSYVYMKDTRLHYTYGNHAILGLLGCTAQELKGSEDIQFFPIETVKRLRATDLRVLLNGEQTSEEITTYQQYTGHHTYLDVKNPIYLDAEEKTVAGLLGIATDITERKRLENERAVSEIKYRRLFESAKDGILILDAVTGMIVDVNPFLIKLLGYSRDQFIEKEIWKIGFFKDIAENKDKFLELQQKEYVRYENLPLETYDGRQIHVEFVSNVYEVNNLKVIQCNIRDISERIHAEKSLREVHWRLEQVVAATHSGTWEWNVQSGEVIFNEEWAKIIGYTLDELAPVSILTWEKYCHPDDWEQSSLQLKRHFEGEIPAYECECRMRHKNGSWIWINDVGHLVSRTAEGLPLLMFGAHTDISERKESEQTIQLKNEELQRTNTEKDKFFSIIAHDLKSPFNGFLGLTEIMANELQSMSQPEIQKIADLMTNSAANLYRLLENLLEWSRMQRGLTTFEPSSFLLLPMISESLVFAREAAHKKTISINTDIPDDLSVYADENMVKTIIRNLVSNAIKFTCKGGSVSVTANILANDNVTISVRDTGIGMSQDVINNLFRLDCKTGKSGTEGETSTGLGLIICKDFIGKHGGKLEVESDPGKGSVFYFNLKLDK